jgi:Ice-binding-like
MYGRSAPGIVRGAGMAVALSIGLLAVPSAARAAGPSPVTLGLASPFAVLAGSPAITSTGPTLVTGEMGIDPYPTVAGFPSGQVVGEIHRADRVAAAAKRDLEVAYRDAAERWPTATLGTLGGLTLTSGVYAASDATLDLTGTLTLDGAGDPNSVWIFQSATDLVTASSSAVRLVNGAQACNVFWQVTGSATLGAGSTIVGTILAATSIALQSNVTLAGRALALSGTVAMIDAVVTGPGCAIPLGRAQASTTAPATTTAPDLAPLNVSYQVAGRTMPDVNTAGSPPVVPAAIVLIVLVAMVLAEANKPRPRVRARARWRDASGYR